MSSLTNGELIEALSKFPKDWPVQLGLPNSDEACLIKGIFECSEYDYGYPLYEFIQIEPMIDLDVDALEEGKVELYGDRVWYNTKDTFRILFSDLSEVKYKLGEKGEIILKECKNLKGEGISLEDIDENYDWEYGLNGELL